MSNKEADSGISKEEMRDRAKRGDFSWLKGGKCSNNITDIFGTDDIEEIYEANKKAIQAIHKGFDMVSEEKVKEALQNMKDLGYEQGLQNACVMAEDADPILLQAIATICSEGNSRAGEGEFGGLFMQGGISNREKPQNQVAKALIKLGLGTKTSSSEDHDGPTKSQDQSKTAEVSDKKAISRSMRGRYSKLSNPRLKLEGKTEKWKNPIGEIQSWTGWNEKLAALNKDDAMFGEAWAEAAGDFDWVMPAVAKVYDLICKCKSNTSQATTNINGGDTGAVFPLATKDLTKAYFVQDFGLSSIDAAVTTVSDSIVIKVPEGTPFHCPCNGKVTDAGYLEPYEGYVLIYDDTCHYVYGIGGMESPNISKGATAKQDSILGTSKGKLIIRIYDENGKSYISPKGIWSRIDFNTSTTKSIGQQIADTNAKQTVVTMSYQEEHGLTEKTGLSTNETVMSNSGNRATGLSGQLGDIASKSSNTSGTSVRAKKSKRVRLKDTLKKVK